MSVAALVEELRAVGGEIALRDGELRVKAPRGAISPDLQGRLKASRDALIAVLASTQTVGAAAAFAPIDARPLEEPVRLSHAQQRLWFMDQLSPGSAFLNLPGCLRIRGALDVPALRWAVAELGARHDALRAAIATVDGEPRQIVQEVTLSLQARDLSSLPESEIAEAMDRAREEAARTPMTSSSAPLLRFLLFRASAEEHALLFVASHLIFDGSSRDLVFRDLRLLYEARVLGTPVPPPPRQRFRDFAAWHRAWVEKEPPTAEAAFWKTYLAGMPATLDLPTDQARPTSMTYAGRHESFDLEPALVARLRRVAQQHRATFSMVALAAAEVVLARYSGQSDFGVGMPVHGRIRPEAEDVVGMFVNTLVMRSALPAGGTFADLLGRVRDTTLDALQHQNLPFDQLVQIAQPARERGRTPLFQAMFSHQRVMTHASAMGLVLEDVPVFASTAATDITFWLFEYENHVAAAIETAADLFGEAATKRYARSFRHVLTAIAENPALPLDQIPILAEEDERHLLFTLNETRAPWEETALVHRIFERAVDAKPSHRALLFEEQRLDYGELDAKANQLAHLLRQRGVGKDSRVGVFLRRGPDLIVALLAVHKAGGGYVPLDPMFPADRVEYVLADCGAQVLITTTELVARLATHPEPILFDRDADLLRAQPQTRLDERTSPDGIAYVIYTSGSTGRPKGVMVEHRNVVSFFAGMERAIDLNGEGVWLSATTVAFDISVLEILGSLTHGRTVILLGETVLGEIDDERYGIPGLVRRHGVTHFQCTPTQCRILLLDEEGRRTLRSLRQLVVGGEAVPQDLADELTGLVSGEVINAYGPTETTVWSTTARLRKGERVTIGAPIANTIAFVVDPQLRPVPLGAVGELCLGGPGVTRGYLGREELTAEKFVPNKLRPDVGGRLYRTGDLVKHAGDGTLVYLGRNDHQVKIRGFRIELGEIETLLRKVPGVDDVAVIAQGDGGEKRLVAYVVTSGAFAGDANVRTELRTSVPEYMVPGVFVHLDALPLTPNGKLDRNALPAPDASSSGVSSASYVPPDNDIERVLCDVWSQVLRVPQVSATSDFFALGGHSLLAVQIFNAIEKAFDVRLPMATLFERPTVRLLAERLREASPLPEMGTAR